MSYERKKILADISFFLNHICELSSGKNLIFQKSWELYKNLEVFDSFLMNIKDLFLDFCLLLLLEAFQFSL